MDPKLPDAMLAEFEALAAVFAKQNVDRPADDPQGHAWMLACVWTRELVQRCRQTLLAQRVETLGVAGRLVRGGSNVSLEGGFYFCPKYDLLVDLCEHYAWHDVGRREYELEQIALSDVDYD